jgi:hypothetical protein
MTRAERAAEKLRREKAKLAEKEQAAKDAVAEQRKAVAQAEAAQREAARKDLHKRRYHVGALAHEAGLFVWSNADLAAFFAALARLQNVPNPVAVLEGVLGAETGIDVGGVNGSPAGKPLSRFLSGSPDSERENSPSPSSRLAGI